MKTVDSESVEEMYELLKCMKCGSRKFTKGRTNASFFCTEAKFLKFKFPTVNVSAKMCLDCGFIELTGDVKKVKYLTEE